MENNKIIVTVIDGLGTVEAQNDLAHFTVTVRSKSETLENAKTQTEEKTNQLLNVLASFKDKGMKLDTELLTSVANYKLEHREGNERTPAGFQSINTITFTNIVDKNLDEVYKACLKFDAHMPSPSFSIKNRTILQDQAIQKATNDAKEKLNTECSLLGVSPDKLKIQNWNFGYEGYLPAEVGTQNLYLNATSAHDGMKRSVVGGAQNYSATNIQMKIGTTYQELLDYKLEPGMVSVSVAVRVNYIWAN